MDALEFLSERKRMCNSYKGCYGCPFAKELCIISHVMPDEGYERIIATVEQWSNEHPVKTRQSKFLEQWPNCTINDQTDDDDRLRELAEADKDGRLVVLPVKPVLTPILSSMLYIIEDEDIYEDALYEAVVGMSENGEMNVVYTTLSDQITFEQADIGKTVFLTREEAEKALEAMK